MKIRKLALATAALLAGAGHAPSPDPCYDGPCDICFDSKGVTYN